MALLINPLGFYREWNAACGKEPFARAALCLSSPFSLPIFVDVPSSLCPAVPALCLLGDIIFAALCSSQQKVHLPVPLCFPPRCF